MAIAWPMHEGKERKCPEAKTDRLSGKGARSFNKSNLIKSSFVLFFYSNFLLTFLDAHFTFARLTSARLSLLVSRVILSLVKLVAFTFHRMIAICYLFGHWRRFRPFSKANSAEPQLQGDRFVYDFNKWFYFWRKKKTLERILNPNLYRCSRYGCFPFRALE